MELLEDNSVSGMISKDGYFTYSFSKDRAILTLEKDAHMALLNINKYVDDYLWFFII
ncbi:MAG: hypothetical protein K2L12_06280 [Clostridia bacterium]|nr:hypothetical protein [Clostridia bacterium]